MFTPSRRSDTTRQDFDEVAYENDRLEKDAQAMEAMKTVAENEFAKLRTPWKWGIRKRIWDMMEETNIARFPRPVHHRIPNFVGADFAAARLADLPEFLQAKCIKVNPDTPQRPVRHAVLATGKTLLTPQPRLRTGFFSTIRLDNLPSLVEVDDCTNSKGVAKWGTPVTLNDKYTVDLVVVGSTAVCPETGARVGKV
jgi:5-formyltetrahydrofolate cyclo-ligase